MEDPNIVKRLSDQYVGYKYCGELSAPKDAEGWGCHTFVVEDEQCYKRCYAISVKLDENDRILEIGHIDAVANENGKYVNVLPFEYEINSELKAKCKKIK